MENVYGMNAIWLTMDEMIIESQHEISNNVVFWQV